MNILQSTPVSNKRLRLQASYSQGAALGLLTIVFRYLQAITTAAHAVPLYNPIDPMIACPSLMCVLCCGAAIWELDLGPSRVPDHRR
jgi:hypothetical protein